jgi:hypothetical protein
MSDVCDVFIVDVHPHRDVNNKRVILFLFIYVNVITLIVSVNIIIINVPFLQSIEDIKRKWVMGGIPKKIID